MTATNFVGYENESCDSKIIAIVKDNEEVNELSDGTAFLITSYTPFYAECGGQCGDTSIIETRNGAKFKVNDILKFCDTITAHKGEIIFGQISTADDVYMRINSEKRCKIRVNHTATHLLQAALRSFLGKLLLHNADLS